MPEKSWIQNAIIYQIYPLTFNYAKGSESDPYKGAYGNLKGITEKVDYIKKLGVDAIWISPFLEWNRNGFGYDIINYEKIAPMYGTKNDLEELIKTFHNKGIKVLMDQVINHCSMEHLWFKKSIKREEPYTNYFVWADSKGKDKNGKLIPPNNWPSTWDSSGNSAWYWNEERQQFYMHSFDYTMPNLNINNLKVQNELLKISKDWFDLGIDGFRLDGTCHYGHDPELRDNPLIENN
ncbi:glycoside hydrolase, partial [Anaeromyces robustus]